MTTEPTPLPDFNAFRLLVDHERQVAARHQRVDSIVILQLERLTPIVDAGTDAFEAALDDITLVLRRTARDSDIICRLGDDTFGVYALDCTGDTLRRRLRIALAMSSARMIAERGEERVLRLRVGAITVQPADEIDDMMRRARESAVARRP